MTPEEIDESTRGKRVRAIRDALGITGEGFADRLNDAAEQMGLSRYWTSPKITNTEKDKRDLSFEDAIAIAHLDPKPRGWMWVAWGFSTRSGEDAFAAFARNAKRRGKGA